LQEAASVIVVVTVIVAPSVASFVPVPIVALLALHEMLELAAV
jgi:hypothetical protein